MLLTLALFAAGCIFSTTTAALREPAHPRRNVGEFTPVEAKFARFSIRATNRGEPCLDELEIYAIVSADARRVQLKLSRWKAGFVTTVQSKSVRSAQGEPLRHDTFHYTLNQIPK